MSLPVFSRDAPPPAGRLAVIGPSGKRLGTQVVEANAGVLIEVLRGTPKRRHLCMEEETLSGWLHEVLEDHDRYWPRAWPARDRPPRRSPRDARSRVGFDMDFRPKFGPLGWIMGKTLMVPKFRKILGLVLEGLETHLRTGEVVSRKPRPAAAA